MNITENFLAISVLSALFLRTKLVLYACILITIIIAFYQQIIFLPGIIFFAVFIILLQIYAKTSYKVLKVIIFAIISLMLVGVLIHKIPGFSNTLVFEKIKIGKARIPYTMYHNFDKVMAALIIYAFSKLLIFEKPFNLKTLRQTFLIFIMCLIVIMPIAILSDYVVFDLKFPGIFLLWAVNNLLFVCFSEEVIFRGGLQKTLMNTLPDRKIFKILSICIAAIIFGLSHYYGGLAYICLATLAGIFYGYAYYKTGKIFCSMLVHFALNTTHFLVFTYPS